MNKESPVQAKEPRLGLRKVTYQQHLRMTLYFGSKVKITTDYVVYINFKHHLMKAL